MDYNRNDVVAARDAQKRVTACSLNGCGRGRKCRHSLHTLPPFYAEVLKAEAERQERNRRVAERAKKVRFRFG